MFKKFAALAAAAALSLGVMTGCGVSGTTADSTGYSAENPLVLTLAHGLSETHTVHIAMTQFADEVAEKTDGRIRVKIFPNGQLGSENENLEQLQAGVIAMTKVSAPGLATYNDAFNTFGLPYIFNDTDDFYHVMDSQEMQDFFLSTGDDGFVTLTYYTSGARSFYTKDRAIRTPADLKGLKIRVQDMLRILTIPEKFTPVSEKNGEQTHLKDLLPLLKESRPVLIICMVRFVQNIATGLGVGTYYWQYIIGNLGMMGIASVTTILVLPLAFALPGLRKKFGMAGMSVIGILVGCIGYLATFFAGGNMVFFIVAALLVSAGAVPLNMMFNMFIADVADYNEWKGLKRMEGTMGSLTGLSGKIGSAFGGFLMGVLMSASGYVGGAAVQADSAIMMIRVLASVAPLALMLVVAVILRFYTVDKQMPQIKQDLEARAAATTEAAAE